MLGGRRVVRRGRVRGNAARRRDAGRASQGDAVPDSLTFFADLKVALTPAGREPRGRADRARRLRDRWQRWKTLPPVTTVNRIREVKPGAVMLITGSMAPGGRAGEPGAPLRATSSRCSSISATVAGCRSRSRFRIRGVGRWIPTRRTTIRRSRASGDRCCAGSRATFAEPRRRVAADRSGQSEESDRDSRDGGRQHVHRRATTRRSSRTSRATAASRATCRSTGRSIATASIAARSRPISRASTRSTSTRRSRTAASAGDTTYVRVADLNTEYFDAEMRAPLLKRIATETGGRFYTPATASTLAEDVALSKHGVTVVNQMDLWDMPAIFLLLVALVTAEWSYREVAGAGMTRWTGGPVDRWTRAKRLAGWRSSPLLSSLRAALCAQTHLVIVSGLGGEKKYVDFVRQTLADAGRRGEQAVRHSAGRDSVVRRRQRLEEAAFSAGSRRRPTSSARSSAARGARGRRRSDRARAHRPRQRRRRRTPRSAFPVPTSARGLRAAAGEVPDAEGRVHQPDERERRHAARRLAAPNRVDHHGDQELRSSETNRTSRSSSSTR